MHYVSATPISRRSSIFLFTAETKMQYVDATPISTQTIHQLLQVLRDICKESTWNSDTGEDALRECNAKVYIELVLDRLLRIFSLVFTTYH